MLVYETSNSGDLKSCTLHFTISMQWNCNEVKPVCYDACAPSTQFILSSQYVYKSKGIGNTTYGNGNNCLAEIWHGPQNLWVNPLVANLQHLLYKRCLR